MEPLSANLSVSPPPIWHLNQRNHFKLRQPFMFKSGAPPSSKVTVYTMLKSSLSFTAIPLLVAFPSLATETLGSQPDKLTLESILASIDDFFLRNPFFVATCAFIWLIVVPLTEEYFRKFKYVSVIDSFRKLKDDPESQLLDIRESTSVVALGTPNLKILSKNAAHVEFNEEDENAFVKSVVDKFPNPNNTALYIMDNFDGNSLRAAEILFKKGGYKEAYAMKDGIRGKNGWLAIQDTLLPSSVHMVPVKRMKSKNPIQVSQSVDGEVEMKTEVEDDGRVIRSWRSPYPNYPDFRPPSSPIPSKPR